MRNADVKITLVRQTYAVGPAQNKIVDLTGCARVSFFGSSEHYRVGDVLTDEEADSLVIAYPNTKIKINQ